MRIGIVVGVVLGVLTIGLVIGDRVTSRSGDTVAIVGDSITHLNQPAIDAGLGPAFHVRMAALSGVRTDQMLGSAQQLAAGRPKQALINLGTNDVEQGTSVDAAYDNISKMVSMFSTADCVHVVTINDHMLDASGHGPERARQLDAKLLQLPRRFPNVDLVRWDEIIDANIGDNPPVGDLTKDSVHPNDRGVERLVSVYDGAFDGCGRPWIFW